MTSKVSENKKIGVVIEEHFDEHEYKRFLEFFPIRGYKVDLISHLWNNEELTFNGNDHNVKVVVRIEVERIKPSDYQGIILIGGYAMDRLRYQVNPKPGQLNQAPAVKFLREALATKDLKIGTICHSLWLFTSDSQMLRGREVTCAHNIICDVENAGGIVMFDDDGTKKTHVHGNLISGKHPGVVEEFMELFLEEIEKQQVLNNVLAY